MNETKKAGKQDPLNDIIGEIDHIADSLTQESMTQEHFSPPVKGDPPIEETLGHIRDEEGVTADSPLAGGEEEEEVKEFKTVPSSTGQEQNSEEGMLNLSLQGTMKMKLRYEASGQDIIITMHQDCLKIELFDGSEFKIPLKKQDRNSHLKIAA